MAAIGDQIAKVARTEKGERFTKATAAATGQSERVIQRAVGYDAILSHCPEEQQKPIFAEALGNSSAGIEQVAIWIWTG